MDSAAGFHHRSAITRRMYITTRYPNPGVSATHRRYYVMGKPWHQCTYRLLPGSHRGVCTTVVHCGTHHRSRSQICWEAPQDFITAVPIRAGCVPPRVPAQTFQQLPDCTTRWESDGIMIHVVVTVCVHSCVYIIVPVITRMW